MIVRKTNKNSYLVCVLKKEIKLRSKIDTPWSFHDELLCYNMEIDNLMSSLVKVTVPTIKYYAKIRCAYPKCSLNNLHYNTLVALKLPDFMEVSTGTFSVLEENDNFFDLCIKTDNIKYVVSLDGFPKSSDPKKRERGYDASDMRLLLQNILAYKFIQKLKTNEFRWLKILSFCPFSIRFMENYIMQVYKKMADRPVTGPDASLIFDHLRKLNFKIDKEDEEVFEIPFDKYLVWEVSRIIRFFQ